MFMHAVLHTYIFFCFNYLEDGIDSETFLELDPTLMYAMGIKMADCIKLHKIIPEVKVIL